MKAVDNRQKTNKMEVDKDLECKKLKELYNSSRNFFNYGFFN